MKSMEEKWPELYSEEISDILSKPPQRIIRIGVMLMCILIIGILAGSWFFKYPDMVEGEITVSSINVPAALVAKTAGKITHLLVSDGEKVVANQTLGVIENSALFEDVVYLDSILSGFSYENERTISEITEMKPLILGSLQSDFLIFQKNCRDFQTFIALSLLEKKIQSLEKQKNTTDEYYKRIMIQNELQAED